MRVEWYRSSHLTLGKKANKRISQNAELYFILSVLFICVVSSVNTLHTQNLELELVRTVVCVWDTQLLFWLYFSQRFFIININFSVILLSKMWPVADRWFSFLPLSALSAEAQVTLCLSLDQGSLSSSLPSVSLSCSSILTAISWNGNHAVARVFVCVCVCSLICLSYGRTAVYWHDYKGLARCAGQLSLTQTGFFVRVCGIKGSISS